MISFDTNVLIYAADRDGSLRHQQAAALLERAIRTGTCVQTLQSFAEFYNVLTRKMRVAPDKAQTFVMTWRAVLTVEPAGVPDLNHAMRAVRDYKLSFWDALLWATVRRAGVVVLATEDLQDGRVIEGVRIANPFNPANAAAIDAALRY
ncbi:MAG TPA: PIN domain-containing protein [Stellaceae bacterium]|nr:PIN domain-containing protein [Stellaceae bacterium]